MHGLRLRRRDREAWELTTRDTNKMEKENPAQEMTITIFPSSDGDGFMYDIYLGTAEEVAEGELESVDGGLCTSTIENALEMATQQAGGVLLMTAKRCTHYQCRGERVEGTDACKEHQFCSCEKVHGRHYTTAHVN